MTAKGIDLTAPTIVEQIESALETYPDHPYQRAFAIPDLRQELITYVLSRISSCDVAVDKSKQLSLNFKTLTSPEIRGCLEALIYQGIRHILNENEERLSHQIPEEFDSEFASSYWF